MLGLESPGFFVDANLFMKKKMRCNKIKNLYKLFVIGTDTTILL